MKEVADKNTNLANKLKELQKTIVSLTTKFDHAKEQITKMYELKTRNLSNELRREKERAMQLAKYFDSFKSQEEILRKQLSVKEKSVKECVD